MSNPYSTRVNQKLLHGDMCLRLLGQLADAERQQKLALQQAATVHLAIALKLYFRELASVLGMGNPEQVYGLSDLDVEPYSGNGNVQELLERPELQILLAAEQSILNPVIQADVSLITGAGSAPSGVEPSAAQVEGWLQLLRELTERQRQGFVEY